MRKDQYKAEELLKILDGDQPSALQHAQLEKLGQALHEYRPQIDTPDPIFKARLKTKLMNTDLSKPRFSLKQILIPAIGVPILIVAAFMFFKPDVSSPVPIPVGDPSGELAGALTLANGSVEYRAEDNAWKSLSEGDTLNSGVEIRTNADSRAVVTLDDGSAIRLNPKTQVALAEVSRNSVLIQEDHGTAYYRVIKDENRTFTVDTPEGSVTALGTAFAVARDADNKKLDVYSIESSVKVALKKDGDKLEKTVNAGEILSFNTDESLEEGTEVSELDIDEISEIPFFKWNLREDAKEGHSLGAVAEIPKVSLAITNPANGAALGEEPVIVTGTTDPGYTVIVNGEEAKADENGVWKVTLEFEKGEHEISVKVNDDLAGDVTGAIGVTVGEVETKVVDPEPTKGISLWGKTSGTTASLSWSVSGVDVSKGFKVVKSTEPNPVYPGNSYKYLSSSSKRGVSWGSLSPNTTYYFRVCQYLGGKCVTYSNNLKLTTGADKPVSTSGSISLSGNVSGTTANLSWSVSGVDVSKGFKVVKSTEPNPVYPGNSYKYLSDSGARNLKWAGMPAGKTLYFRTCQYLGGKCGTYSNNLKLTTAAETPVSTSGSISLSGNVSGTTANLSWSVSGVDVSNGFKVVYSTEPNPVYPGNTYQYLSDSGTRSTSWTKLPVGKTLYFRTCQYLGGKCGVYSNNLTLTTVQ